MSYFLGIDLGTSSVKALLIRMDGQAQGFAQEHYSIDVPQAGWAEQSPEMWWKAAVRAIRKALAVSKLNPGDIRGIGFSGQMHGLVALDRNGKAVRPGIIWADQRSIEQVEEINAMLREQQFLHQTMNAVSTGFALPSLLWMKEHEPAHFASIDKILLPKDYLRYRLTGEVATEATDASSTLAFNTLERAWAYDLLNKLNVPVEFFPDCYNPMDLAGYVTEKAALETGLKVNTPVVYGGSDQCMQAVGNGIVAPGIVSLNIGTGGQVSTMLEQPLYDEECRMNTFNHIFPNTWNIQGSSLNSGLSVKWLKDNVLHLRDFDEMTELASRAAPGSEGVIFLPYLSGERTPHMDPLAKSCFFGLTLKHRQEHMVRSVFEGVVYSLRDALELLEAKGIRCEKVIASGGGAKSPVWLQIQADILGKEIFTTTTEEEACVGAAIMAAVGTGAYPSVHSACRHMIAMREVSYRPNLELASVYHRSYSIFKQLYQRNYDLFQAWL
ncbi:xylulokinase [Paenibacillus elgii]|uniref:xylulokinase n=1 Tax=Paenibacillus elgii TaxID=189691 RepID=UPI00203DEB5B|nr:xylulokinase [Paenibacillus elgii]MCM3270846.1 xylulokinase [Paenibacillus elgii]